jgi:spermidine synthase/fumarate reductase subunit C
LGFLIAAAAIIAGRILLRDNSNTEPAEGWSLWRLCVVSFLTLFAELAVIRWIGTEIRVFAYVKNLALLLCFLGFGLGCALAKSRVRWRSATIALLGLLMIVQNPWGGRAMLQGLSSALGAAQDIEIWATGTVTHWPSFLLASAVALLLLFLITCVFIPFGQVVSREIDLAPTPLLGYSWNLASSLAGILAFFVVSWSRLTPAVWLTLLFIGIAVLQTGRKARLVTGSFAVPVVLLLHIPAIPHHLSSWSPYQQLEADQVSFATGEWRDTVVIVNHTGYQIMVDLAPEFLAQHPGLLKERVEENPYNLPFRFAAARPKVLIVGAGTGNDVAAAVRNGSRSVDAVEIDPVILSLGKTHPEHPYASALVTTYVTDARAFLKRAQGPYDLVLFGLLDSHTQLSDYANVRIDNFVYTEESFREAKKLLAPDGLMFIKFQVDHGWLGKRLGTMLADVFGKPPLMFNAKSSYSVPSSCFAISPSSRIEETLKTDPSLLEFVQRHESSFSAAPSVTVTTDDWPYLYQEGRWIPAIFFCISLLVVLLAVALYWQIPDARRRAPSLFFFSMGAGFLLLETQVISRLALYFGTTWQVNGIVIGAILATLLIANAVVAKQKLRLHRGWILAGILGGLLLAYLLPFSRLPGSATFVGGLAAAIFAIPVFFAGILFAGEFQASESPSAALGANMLGAVVGGLLENLSLVIGMRALLIVALIVYSFAGLGLHSAMPSRARFAARS